MFFKFLPKIFYILFKWNLFFFILNLNDEYEGLERINILDLQLVIKI